MASKTDYDKSYIKICGLFRPEDIFYVNEALPDYAGFIINFEKSHRNVSPDTVVTLKSLLLPDIKSVGVFVDEDISSICRLYDTGALDVIQLHGHESNIYINELRKLIPKAIIWKAFKIRRESDIMYCMKSDADMILLDNGCGTGDTFNWKLTKNITRPYILAGGLTPKNIPDAIKKLKPWGIDISSGVETNKLKDKKKIISAVAAARSDMKGAT